MATQCQSSFRHDCCSFESLNDNKAVQMSIFHYGTSSPTHSGTRLHNPHLSLCFSFCLSLSCTYYFSLLCLFLVHLFLISFHSNLSFLQLLFQFCLYCYCFYILQMLNQSYLFPYTSLYIFSCFTPSRLNNYGFVVYFPSFLVMTLRIFLPISTF